MSVEQFRSFTHPVTNFAGLSGSDAQSQLRGLLSLELPPSTWSASAHELTHHWCFNSPVGWALTYLYLRPLGLRLEHSEEALDEARFSTGLDLITYDVTLGLLWPIIEGMALVTEFDLVPNRSDQLYSIPLQSTFLLYARRFLPSREPGSVISPDQLDEALLAFLFEQRSGEQLIRRKSGILAQPLREAKEGYLASYLLAKNMWMTLHRDNRLWNVDVFLCFVRLYFFCDMALVALLLEPDDGQTDRYRTVADYITTRLSLLEGSDLGATIDAIVGYISTQGGSTMSGERYTASADKQRAALDALPVSSADHELWRRGIDMLVEEMIAIDEKATKDEDQGLSLELKWMLSQRDSFCVIHEPVRVQVTSARMLVALLQGESFLAAPAIDQFDLPVGQYDGTVSGYFIPNLGASFVAIAINGRIGAIWFSRDLPEPFRRQLLSYRMNGPELLKGLEGMRRTARNYVNGDPAIAIIADAMKKNIASWKRGIAANNALPHVPSARRAEVLGLLDQAGFGAVVGSASRLRGLATISLLASFRISRGGAARLFDAYRDIHECEDSYEQLVEFVRHRGQEVLNDPLLFDVGPGLFSAV